MSKRARPRVFSGAFKREVVEQWERGERSGAQLVREHELSRSLLHRWRAECRALGADAFTGAGGRGGGAAAPGGAVGTDTGADDAGERGAQRGAAARPGRERTAMIAELQAADPQASVRWLCRVLGVSRSGVYAARARTSEPPADEARVVRRIEELRRVFPSYGYRRVTATLRREGMVINGKRVLRLMRQAALRGQVRQYVRAERPDPDRRDRPNLLRGAALTGPNQAWVADLTYGQFPRSTGFLAGILDAWSRRCIGWAIGAQMTSALAEEALERAMRRGRG